MPSNNILRITHSTVQKSKNDNALTTKLPWVNMRHRKRVKRERNLHHGFSSVYGYVCSLCCEQACVSQHHYLLKLCTNLHWATADSNVNLMSTVENSPSQMIFWFAWKAWWRSSTVSFPQMVCSFDLLTSLWPLPFVPAPEWTTIPTSQKYIMFCEISTQSIVDWSDVLARQ